MQIEKLNTPNAHFSSYLEDKQFRRQNASNHNIVAHVILFL